MRGSKTSVGEHRDSLQSLLSTLCSEERGIPLLRQKYPCTARGDPPSTLFWMLSSPGFLMFWCYVRNVSIGSVLQEPGKRHKDLPSQLTHTIWKWLEQPSRLKRLKPVCWKPKHIPATPEAAAGQVKCPFLQFGWCGDDNNSRAQSLKARSQQ